MDNNSVYKIAIGLVPGIGNVMTRQLISYCGSVEEVFKQPKAKLLKVPGIGEIAANAIVTSDALQQAEKIAEKAEKQGHKIYFYTDADYPERLKTISDAPTLLYYSGSAGFNHQRVVAIVGTRRATEYGKKATEAVVTSLVKYNCLIVSGLAYGIDIAAHRTALKVGLPTIGVMASGLDFLYPSEHKKTAEQMLANGGTLTEQTYGVKAEAHHFPARNRIIAGMADATVVIEAAEKGGALISAEIANSYDKDVFAIPGNIDQPFSRGCNRLIAQNKAVCLADPYDLPIFMNWDLESKPISTQNKGLQLNIEGLQLNDQEKSLLKYLEQHREVHIDELSRNLQIPVNSIGSVLLQLEFQGLVKSLAGKKFALLAAKP